MPPGLVADALATDRIERGQALLGLAEDQWFDRKSSKVKARALGDVLCGFGNADGGIVVVGLSDGGIEGVGRLGRRLNDLMQAHMDFVVPPARAHLRLVPCVNDAGLEDNLLVIDIDPSDGVVHSNTRDEVFLRVGDENRRLTFTQRQELQYDRGQGSFEARVVDGSELSEIDRDLLDRYATSLDAPDAERLLVARGLAKDTHLTVAGTLLFSAHPQQWLPEAYVRVLRYRGSARGTGARQQLLDDVRCEGPISSILSDARDQVAARQPTRRALARSGRFEAVPLVPEDAWLEAIVNAVVHRSYSLAGDHIRVEIFDDRIEVSSPGRFPGLVDIADPVSASRLARNPRIARVCADLQFGQELGEGIRRMYDEMRVAGLQDPIYRQTASNVHLTLSGEPVDRELDAQLTPEARAVSVALREAGRLSTGEVAEMLGRSRPSAIKILRSLEAAGVVRWVGKSSKDPRAYWEAARR